MDIVVVVVVVVVVAFKILKLQKLMLSQSWGGWFPAIDGNGTSFRVNGWNGYSLCSNGRRWGDLLWNSLV